MKPSSGSKFIYCLAISLVCLFPKFAFANEGYARIIGKISSEYAVEPKDFRVSVFGSIDHIPHQPLITTITDHNGVFSYNATEEGSFILEIEGEKGSGRVYIDGSLKADTIRISYPVLETIVFLHTNDHHFDINLVEKLSEVISHYRNQYTDVFLLEAGDIFVRHPHRWEVNGTLMEDPQWYADRAIQMVRLRNELKYDVMTPGNHELDYIQDYTLTALKEADFPLIAANIEVSTEYLPEFEEYIILPTTTGRQLAFLGLTTGNAQGLKLHDIFKTANNYMHLRDSADIFVALTHIGHNRDKTLAENFPQIDVIIGGHSHTLLEEAILINEVLVAQAGGNPHIVSDEHPVFLGIIVVELENGLLTNKHGRVIKVIDN